MHRIRGALVTAAVLVAGPALAGGPVALQTLAPAKAAALSVALSGVAPGGPLPTNYAFEGRNLSPPLSWSAGPPVTKSYAVVMQDPDAPGAAPLVHWVVYDIPAAVTGLPRGLRNVAEPTHPLGALQGRNGHGSLGYSGPQPPPSDPPHHYHLQVFALDVTPRVRPGADWPVVEHAMAGHVVAAGELIATYPGPPPAHKAAGSGPAAPGG